MTFRGRWGRKECTFAAEGNGVYRCVEVYLKGKGRNATKVLPLLWGTARKEEDSVRR